VVPIEQFRGEIRVRGPNGRVRWRCAARARVCWSAPAFERDDFTPVARGQSLRTKLGNCRVMEEFLFNFITIAGGSY
jgi:hypothetical protein